MTSQQPQFPNAVIPPHLAQNSSAQHARAHIQANQLDSSQSATAGPLDHRALTGRPGCSGVAATSGEVANRNVTSCTDSNLSRRDGGFEPWPEEAVDNSHGLYSLHRMFDIVGAQLTHRDVRVLSFLFVDVIDEYERGGIRSGRDFLLALERQGRCDETNFRHVLQLLRIITRHDLLPYVTLRKRQAGECSCIITMFTPGPTCRFNVLLLLMHSDSAVLEINLMIQTNVNAIYLTNTERDDHPHKPKDTSLSLF